MKKITYIAAVLLCVAVFLAGCSASPAPKESEDINKEAAEPADVQTNDSEPQSASLAIIEPEQLISKQEAQELLGEEVSEGEKTFMESVGQKIIFYDSQADGSFASLQISLTQPSTIQQGSTITPEEVYGAAKAGLEETSDVDISGIGEDCFTGTPGLHILSEGCYIVISAGNTDDPAVQEILKKAGKLAVANLEKLI